MSCHQNISEGKAVQENSLLLQPYFFFSFSESIYYSEITLDTP